MLPTRRHAGFLASLGTGAYLALAVLPAAGPLSTSAYAQTADVKIDSLKVGAAPTEVEFKGVEFIGTNLSRDEVLKLFATDTAGPERTALATKLKASSASIAEIAPKAADAGNLTFRGLRLEGLSDGKIARLTLAGFDGAPVFENAPVPLKGGALTIDEIDLSTVLKAAQSGSIDDLSPKAARMSWNGFEIAVPDKDTPATAPGGNLIKIRLGALDGQSTYDGNLPLQSSGAIRNLVLEFPPASEAGKLLTTLGYDKLDLGMTYRGGYDPARKSFMLDDFTVSGVNAGSLGLRAEFGNLDPAGLRGTAEQKLGTLMGADFDSTDLRIINSGVFEKGLAFLAKQQGKSPDTLRNEWSALATQFAPMLLGGEPSSLQVAAALGGFLKNGKSLTISVKGKNGPVKLASVNTTDPTEALKVFSISAVNEGAAIPAPAANAQQTAQVAPQAAQAGRKLVGLDAWNQIVGNSVVGKSEDGDPLTEFYLKNGKLKQLIDDEVTNGTWVLKGQQVCMVYGDDDDDDEECYKLEVVGDVATFIDSDGKGKRYTIVKGNPKKL